MEEIALGKKLFLNQRTAPPSISQVVLLDAILQEKEGTRDSRRFIDDGSPRIRVHAAARRSSGGGGQGKKRPLPSVKDALNSLTDL
ncbi:hypothetical protein EYF80_021095 [Liparis tanakae]|uniref:Uncharacterized protein n=1 Tax=Liparis tanakae TaxID=230148 RepID=A0A4Z2HS69_9TELE|nr:hypothetical protein EYF80_021095 [Liparis tanakae]